MVTLVVTHTGEEADAPEFAQKLAAHVGQNPVVEGPKHTLTFGKQEEIDHVKQLLPQVMDNITFEEPKPVEPKPPKPVGPVLKPAPIVPAPVVEPAPAPIWGPTPVKP